MQSTHTCESWSLQPGSSPAAQMASGERAPRARHHLPRPRRARRQVQLRGLKAPAPAEALAGASLPGSYKCLRAFTTGDSFRDVARVVEVDLPQVGPEQVLIRVTHAGINGGCETFRARGEHWFERNQQAGPDGFALGAEGAGVIAAVGNNVTHLQPGTACTFVGGAFAEYTLANAAMCFPVPDANAEVVALTISGVTACVGLEVTGAMKPSDTVLVTAAAGGTGHFAVQLAKRMGCHVVATCGGAAKVAALAELGADRIIDHTKEDVRAVLKKEYPKGMDLVYEGVGGSMLEMALDNLAVEGTLLVVGYISEYPHESSARTKEGSTIAEGLFWSAETVQRGKQTIRGNVWPKDDRKSIVDCKRKVFQLFAEGKLKVLLDDSQTFEGLESIPDAIEHMLSGSTIGKVVVTL
eukprot:CAMPEP_0114288918 /NCGR_PEP_ID=MMETSP0059-20121206/7077_1 /TAXON_ID=36894 /ORGANISM="Pyramimonas parkeae, Strain CCMP726" /LENGTH=410 /DNA_ID=CAMNT_0001410117 /DNA_START=135 /DNA_END=1368 /DNA_ORIENTATION=+